MSISCAGCDYSYVMSNKDSYFYENVTFYFCAVSVSCHRLHSATVSLRSCSKSMFLVFRCKTGTVTGLSVSPESLQSAEEYLSVSGMCGTDWYCARLKLSLPPTYYLSVCLLLFLFSFTFPSSFSPFFPFFVLLQREDRVPLKLPANMPINHRMCAIKRYSSSALMCSSTV